jgi:pyridoxal phosphate phosphatase PHOSPHO2
MAPERLLVVFDFDWSMSDQDTDRWVFEVNAIDLRRKLEDLEGHVQWTDLVATALRDFHERGGTREQIETALKIMPFHPAMVRTLKGLKKSTDPETTLFCLSNANTVFISTILQDKGLDGLFTEVVTNPAEWDGSGLLELRRRIDPTGVQHRCTVGCSANMCKGEELEAFLARHKPDYDQIIYVGDGRNDYCPVLHLRSKDTVLCRRGKGLEGRIEKEGPKDELKCQVYKWDQAWEVEEYFKKHHNI